MGDRRTVREDRRREREDRRHQEDGPVRRVRRTREPDEPGRDGPRAEVAEDEDAGRDAEEPGWDGDDAGWDAEDAGDAEWDGEEGEERRGPGEDAEDAREPSGRGRARGDASSREQVGRVGAAAAARAGLQGVAELVGKQPEGVAALEPAGDGWRVGVEVVEDRRIPSSADILAIYEVDLGPDGDLLSYRRTQRYVRGRGDQGGGD